MLKTLKSLFSKSDELKPDEYTVYTVHEGKEYVSHDGLGLMTPDPNIGSGSDSEPTVESPDWQEISQAGGIFEDSDTESVTDDDSLFTDDMLGDYSSSLGNDGGIASGSINPATGLPMANSMIDVGGNVYGMSDDSMSLGLHDSMGTGMDDTMGSSIGMDDSMGIGTGMDSDFGIDSFGNSDDGFL
ncbi:hypothetical protein [Marinobacter orientalis]|uniref:Uncharacterized protein n=1 Tax=Marinobacter orientalis TaxID=1928859 RepID=A0A7Y0RB94_9GAMM|nr:hypothetical protein [Marinobacter orientalis]NMT62791.1 hypothetical protein [Marinobacter orientalis]TGX51470.1 hypothetical protein DIT72_05450 [Marinobacter orientalis]